mgnify:CR=1 FL=1
MNEKLLHTPEGVRDIYDAECKKKKKVISQIHHVLELYSYQDIDTPSFEYFDIFNMDKGSAASNEMYKFFDRNNNTLVLRPDITPSIARSVAKYYPEEQLPIRLCYAGNTFLNTHQHQGKLSEFTQIAAAVDTCNETADQIQGDILSAKDGYIGVSETVNQLSGDITRKNQLYENMINSNYEIIKPVLNAVTYRFSI